MASNHSLTFQFSTSHPFKHDQFHIMQKLLVLLLLILLPARSAMPDSACTAKCSLEIQGAGPQQPGIRHASLHCGGGGPLTVAFNASALNASNFAASGVALQLLPTAHVNESLPQQGCSEPRGCLLSICNGSKAVFTSVSVMGVQSWLPGESGYADWINGTICVAGGSSVIVRNANVSCISVYPAFLVAANSSVVFEYGRFSHAGAVFGGDTGVFVRLLGGATVDIINSTMSDDASGIHPGLLPDSLERCPYPGSFVDGSSSESTLRVVGSTLSVSLTKYITASGSITLRDSVLTSQCFGDDTHYANGTAVGAADEARNQSLCYGAHAGGVSIGKNSTLLMDNVSVANGLCGYRHHSDEAGAIDIGDGSHVVLRGVRFSRILHPVSLYVWSNTSLLVDGCSFDGISGRSIQAGGAFSKTGETFGNLLLSVNNTAFSVINSQGPPGVSGACILAAGDQNVTLVLDNVSCSHSGPAQLTNMTAMSADAADVSPGEQGAGAGIAVVGEASVHVVDSIIEHQRIYPGFGGGLVLLGNITAALINSSFAGNVAGTGAGIYADSLGGAALINVSGCVFADNVAVSGGGADIFASSSTQLLITNSSIDVGSPSVVWWRTQCVLGEVLQAGRCVRCGRFMYSLEPSNSSCDLCPPAGANCTGGDAIVPLAGWWHSDRHSIQLHKCPHLASSQQQQPVCQYGGSCAAGYAGNLCGVCLSGFGSLGPFKCGRCLSRAAQWVWYGCGALFLLAVLAYTVAATWRDNQSSSTVLRPSDLLKALILFVQYLVIVGSLSVPWPPSVTGLFAAANWVFAVSAGQALSLDCLLVASSSKLPLAIQRALVLLGAPLVMLAAVLLLDVAWRVCCWVLRCASTAAAKSRRVVLSLPQPQRCGCPLVESLQRLPVMAVVVLFVFYPSLVRMALSFFACYAIDDTTAAGQQMYAQYSLANAAGGYWVSDLSQACWSGWHFWWALCLGVSASAVLCVGVPAVLLAGLWCNRARLQAPGFRQRFGWLYRNFRPGRFWWEVLLALQTCVLVALSVFRFTLGVYYSTLLLNAAFLVGVLLQLLFRPFASAKLHRLQLLASTCLLLTTCIALSLFSLDVASHAGYRQVIGGIAVGVNAGFVCWCCWCILVESQGRLAGLARALAVAVQHAARRCLPAAAAAAAAHEALPSATHQVSLLKAPREFVPPA